MRPDCPVVDRRARGNRFDMDKVKRGVVRRIAVQVKQRQRGDAHGTSIFHLTCETTAERDFSNEKPRLAGGAFLISSLRVSDPAADRPADHPAGRASRAGRLAAAGRASAVRPVGRPVADHPAAVGRASGLDFDSFYYPLQHNLSAAHARAPWQEETRNARFLFRLRTLPKYLEPQAGRRVPSHKEENRHGTLLIALAAGDSDPDSGTDLAVWRFALVNRRRFETGWSRPPDRCSRRFARA